MTETAIGKHFNWSFDRRFMSKVEKSDSGCWHWLGSKMRSGYGQMSVGGQRYAAHRYAYQELVGEIPKGLDLDHLCRNRSCVNPDHLDPVTRSENLKRGNVGTWAKAVNGTKTHCLRGHEFSKENTYLHPTGRRVCRACQSLRAGLRRKNHG